MNSDRTDRIVLTEADCKALWPALRECIVDDESSHQLAITLLEAAYAIKVDPWYPDRDYATTECVNNETMEARRKITRIEALELIAKLAREAYWALRKRQAGEDSEDLLARMYVVGRIRETANAVTCKRFSEATPAPATASA